MNNLQPIRTYQDLLKEEQRLNVLVQWHRDQVKTDVDEVKKQFSRVSRIISIIRHPATLLQQNSLPGMGIGVGAGLLAIRLVKNVGGSLLQRLFNKKKSR